MKIIVNNAGDVKTIVVASGAQGPQGPIGALNADDRAYVDAAKASASASESSASASATIATTAQGSATASAAAALVSETNAATSEASSTASASTATAAATNLVTALAAFREVYLGSFSADPAVDGNGNPLKDGAEYYNTTTDKIRVYSGGAWQDKDAAEQQETTNAALSAAAAAASSAAASTSETNAAASATTASQGAATVVAAVTASAASASAAAGSASDALADKTAAAASAAAAAQSAIDAENNAGGALPLAGGIMTGPLSLKYASPAVTLLDSSQAGGAGVFKWTSVAGALNVIRNTAPAGDFSNSTTPLSFAANDVGKFSQRPVFGTKTPWDNGNLVAPLTAADNLSSVADKPAARSNLGVGRTLLGTVIASSQATVNFNGTFITSDYDDYEIEYYGVQFNVTGNLLVRASFDGITYSGAAGYYYARFTTQTPANGTPAVIVPQGASGQSAGLLQSNIPISTSKSSAFGTLKLADVNSNGLYKMARLDSVHQDNLLNFNLGSGMVLFDANQTTPLKGIQLLCDNAGTLIARGTFRLYGLNK